MEQFLSSDLTVASLLCAFIIGMFTKRFVPWWIHEEVVKKLKEYEQTAPELIDEMKRMMRVLEDPTTLERLTIEAPQVTNVNVTTSSKKAQPMIVSDAPRIRVRRTSLIRVPKTTPVSNRSRGKRQNE